MHGAPPNDASESGEYWRLVEMTARADGRVSAGYQVESSRLAGLLEARDSRRDDQDVLWGLLAAAGHAAFLVGLELGRRLGGAR